MCMAGVRFGTCKLVALQGVAAKCLWQRVPVQGASAECRSKVPAKCLGTCAVWSLGAGAAVGCGCKIASTSNEKCKALWCYPQVFCAIWLSGVYAGVVCVSRGSSI